MPSFGWLLVVVLLTTPLQSAAEEYLFRGYLSQAVAGWIRAPGGGAVVAGVLTAALFAAAHVPGDWVTFLDRFAFGLAASAVVWLTGGLEAAIVLHAVNNVLVFVLAGALGDAVATEEVPGGSGLLFAAGEPADDGRVRLVRGRAARRLRARDAHRGADLRPRPGPAAGVGRLTRRPRGRCHPAQRRRVSSSAAPRGATHGVWGNWQPDGFWFR